MAFRAGRILEHHLLILQHAACLRQSWFERRRCLRWFPPFQFLRVVDACVAFLSSSLHLESCIGILNLAESHGLTGLKTAAQNYITSHFSRVAQQQDFLELPAESLETVLQRDHLDVKCEECVFEALMRWVRARQQERRPSLAGLLSRVRLPLLEPAYFVEKVESDELIRGCSEAFPLLQEARTYHLSGREVSAGKAENVRPCLIRTGVGN